MAISDRIVRYLDINRKSLTQFANESGIAFGTLNGIVHYGKLPNYSTIRSLVTYMQCSYDYLLSDSEAITSKDKWFNKYMALPPKLRDAVDLIMEYFNS